MKLLFFSSMGGAPWGGSEELWRQAALAALADRHEVAVSVFDFGSPVLQIAELEGSGAKLLLRPRYPSRIAEFLGRRPWLAEIERWKPDAVCLSQGSAYECVGRRATRPLLPWLERAGVPFVNVVQFNEPKSDLRASTLGMSKRLFSAASANAFVAARNITEASATLGVQVPRARVVRNPVNLRDVSPVPWPESSTPHFATVARLHVDAKGQDMLLAALASRPWAREPWTLSLFGEGQDEAALRDQAASLGLGDRVHFRGQTRDIRSVWATHHALLLPSRAEGTPLAMVEAMLLGRPCLVTDVGGCADWVREGENGVLAPPEVRGLASALDRLWSARERWGALGASARRAAMSLHDPEPGRTLLGLVTAKR